MNTDEKKTSSMLSLESDEGPSLHGEKAISNEPSSPLKPLKQLNCVVINFFGGSCTGKSTIAMALAVKLKLEGFNVEYEKEYVKAMAWQGISPTLSDQLFYCRKAV